MRPPTQTLWNAFANLMSSLGGGGGGTVVSSKVVRNFDGDSAKFATYIIDAFLNRTCRHTCKQTCQSTTFRVQPELIEHAGINFVRALDRVVRAEHNMSLSTFLYTQLTGVMHRYRVPRPELLLRSSQLIQYDVTRGIRLKVLEYVLSEYVYYYLPDGVHFGQVADINASIFKPFRREIISFLKGHDADLAPVIGSALKFISKRYDIHLVSPLCHLCKKLCAVQ